MIYEQSNLPIHQGVPVAVRAIDLSDSTDRPVKVPSAQELLTIIDRLEEVVQTETAALQQHIVSDLAAFTRNKSQILLEVTRLSRLMKLPTGNVRINDRLMSLKTSLAQNRDTLEIHLRAARELNEIISDTVRDAESDGTYSSAGGQGLLNQ